LTFPSFNIGLNDAFGLDSYIEDYSVYVPNLTTLNVFGSKLRTNFGRNFSKLKNIILSDEIMEAGQGCFINTAWYNNQPNGIVYLNKVVLGYKGEKPTGTITVKEGTTVISNSSFYNCSDMTKVVLPQTLKCIGAFAFDGCNLSGELNMPESLQTIQNNAFYGCSNLTKVVFNNGLSSIGNSAFEGCNLTGEMVIPDSIKSLGTNCFKGNNGISKLTLSFVKDVFFLEMFYNVPTSLTEVVVKGSYLPDSAMQNSSNLRKVTLSNEITYIPKNAFKDCYYLTEIYFGNITKIGDGAFMECKSLASFVIKDSVSEIGEKAFYGCSILENITLGNGVKTIGNHVFANCISLEEIVLNDGLESIGNGAFNRTNLNKLVIPESVNYVGFGIMQNLDDSKYLNFKIFVKATEINSNWDTYWNLNSAEYEEGEMIEGTDNYFPTFYYSETNPTENPSDKLLYWHYVDETPELW